MSSPRTSASGQSFSAVLPPLVPLDVPIQHSCNVWRSDLRALFEKAKDRFGDVIWDVGTSTQDEKPRGIESLEESDENDLTTRLLARSLKTDTQEVIETVWGHKAIIYARAPPAFQYRYFPRTVDRSSTPGFRSSSAAYLALPNSEPNTIRTTSPLRVPSQASVHSTASTYRHTPTRIRVGVTPQMFKAELEWLYTGEGMGDVAEWLNQNTSLHVQSSVDDHLEAHQGLFGLGLGLALENGVAGVDDIQKIEGREGEKRESLRNDLVYMWRSKLYSDVKIVLPCESLHTSSGSSTIKRNSFIDSNLSDDSSSSTCAVFSTHKFILASRSPYFASLLLNTSGFRSGDWEETNEIELLSPPFTPASVHFCLGYMYAGTLAFSNRTYDLTTAFEIHRSATYLLMDSLRAEVESRIIHEMCDGLDLSLSPGPSKLCARRVPRVWRFAGASDVGALDLESRTRAWVVRHWASCWGKEIGDAEEHERKALLTKVTEGLNSQSVCRYLRGVKSVKSKTDSELRTTTGLPRGFKQSTWAENLIGMVSEIETQAKEIWIVQFGDVVRSKGFTELLSGKGFGMDLLEELMTDVVNSAADVKGCKHSGKNYQNLVKSILSPTRPDTNEPVLSPGSAVRTIIENSRTKVLEHLRRRWLQVREHSGFVGLESWALQEISDEIGQPVEELVAPPLSPFVPPTRAPPILSSSVSRVVSGSKESVSSNSINRSPSARRLDVDLKSVKNTEAGTMSSRSTISSRTVAKPQSATIPARSTVTTSAVSKSSSSPRPPPGALTTTRPTSEKAPLSNSTSSVSLSGRRSVGGATVSARSSPVAAATAARPVFSSTLRNPPTTASRTSTISSSTSSSSRTRLTSSGKSAPASTPSSSIIISSSTITPSLLTTSPSTKSVNGISEITHKPRPSNSVSNSMSPSSNMSTQSTLSNGSSKPRVSNIRQSPSTTSFSRLSSPTSTNTLSKMAVTPKTSSISAQKTPVPGSRDRLSSTTSSMSIRSSAGSSRTSSLLTSSKSATTATTTAGNRTRTTTSPSMRSLTSSLSTTPTGAKATRQRMHTSPDIPIKAAPVSTNSYTRSSGTTSSVGLMSVTPPLSSLKRTVSAVKLSTASRETSKQDVLNKKLTVSTKPIPRSESALSSKSSLLNSKAASVASLKTIKPSVSSHSIKRSDPAPQIQPGQEVRSPLKPKQTQTSTPTTSSISLGPPVHTQSPSAPSVSSLLSPAIVKRTRSHPASAFDPPKRLPLPRKQLTLDEFSIHSLTTGEAIEPSPGISLHVGIPCIVSIRATGMGSATRGKKVRCKAWARYIGSLVGREGAWVGVELAEDIDGNQQQEEEIGCWNGVRYYKADDLGLGDEWESSEGGTTKKRRSLMTDSAKDEILRRRGMFLAPEDVVWVKGA
ncbi:CAP Gly-rich domain [Phaffia rhodozyma]|uniref:CAP Gly-rich domain n=1 Tax=Phaffia rhodozyma TaxID=264483 RepID=A0A0F7SEL5_PHARH|nr:CAP Gly-rich domain [Phaffia rhodozyma]